MNTMNRLCALALCGLMAVPVLAVDEVAVEEQPTWEVGFAAGVDFCSRQLTYGLIDNDHAILTPSAEISFGNEDWFTLALGVEAIFDTTNWGAKDGGYNDRRYKYQELALGLTLSRTWDTADFIGSSLDTAINYTYEYHPRACKKVAEEYANPDTQWLNLEISAGDYWLVPTLALEYQLTDQGADAKGGMYLTFDLSHEFDIGASVGLDEGTVTLIPTLGIAAGNKQRNRADEISDSTIMLRDAYGTLELNIAPCDYFSITPYVGFNRQLGPAAREATGDDAFVTYFGIGLSAEF